MASVDGSDLENGCLGVLHGGSYFPGFYIIGTWRDLSSSGCLFFFAKEQQECQSSKAIKITLFNRAEWTFPPEQDPNALESHFLPSKTSWSHLHMSLGLPGQFFNHQRPADMSLYSPTLLLHDLEKSMPLLYSAPRPPHLPLLPTLPHESKSSSIWRLILGKCHGFSHHWVSMKISL